jgi:hypothetical protein
MNAPACVSMTRLGDGTPPLVNTAGAPTFKSRPKAHIYLLYAMTAPLVKVIAFMFP